MKLNTHPHIECIVFVRIWNLCFGYFIPIVCARDVNLWFTPKFVSTGQNKTWVHQLTAIYCTKCKRNAGANAPIMRPNIQSILKTKIVPSEKKQNPQQQLPRVLTHQQLVRWKPRVRFWIIECVEVHTKTENQFGSQRTRIHANSCPDTLSRMKNHCLRLEGTKRISRKERERDRVKNGENQEIELICEQWNVCHIIKLTQWQKSIRALLLLSLCVWFLLSFRFFFWIWGILLLYVRCFFGCFHWLYLVLCLLFEQTCHRTAFDVLKHRMQ